jgi:hypothetical protein
VSSILLSGDGTKRGLGVNPEVEVDEGGSVEVPGFGNGVEPDDGCLGWIEDGGRLTINTLPKKDLNDYTHDMIAAL